jgi:hypothetical protein
LRYFVIAPDGSKFGPADIATLRAWIGEGRIAPDTILEEEASRQRVAARFVAGLTFPEMPSFIGATPPYATKPEYAKQGDNGSRDLIMSYICSAMSIICCGFFIIGGFTFAASATRKGNPKGRIATAVAVFFLFLWIITTIIEIKFFGDLKNYFVPKMGLDG